MARYIAIYSKDLFPEEGRIVNKDCDSLEEIKSFLAEASKDATRFWNAHYYDKDTDRYETFQVGN
jgi:hypothetical protein